jgi:predicted Zn-dependent protease
MITKDALQALLRESLKNSPADETELVGYVNSTSLTRFAKSAIHQNVREDNSSIFARVALGKRLGVASTNRLTPEAIRSAMEKATSMAKESPEQSDFPGLPKAAPAAEVAAYSAATASMTPDERADAVGRAAAVAAAGGVLVSGAYRVGKLSMAVANTSGTEQYYDATDAYLSIFATDDDGISGSAADYAIDVGDIDTEALARVAVEKCKAAANPVGIDAGNYDVILEPRATGEIMEWLNFTAFGAKQVHEGMSFMTDRIGEKVMGDLVTIYDDGTDTTGVPIPFDFEGVPKRKVTIIENGVARGPVYDSVTAAKDGVESTGHGSLSVFRGGPGCSNLFIAGGDAEFDDLLAAVKRGLLVTRFHYINGLLDTRKALFTGMTRDGTFLIENGKITKAVKNLRFNDSMLRAYSNVEAVTQKRGVAGRNWGGIGSITAPSVLIRDFRFTGTTEF